MKHALLSYCRSLLLPALLCAASVAAQDVQILGDRSITGTARYTAMAGAMASVGADPSAVLDNPAGLGLYRRMEVSLSLSEQIERNKQLREDFVTGHVFALPQASLVFALENRNPEGGLRFCNFMLSYNRLRSFSSQSLAWGVNQPSLAGLMIDQVANVDERTLAASQYNNDNTGWLSELGYWTYMINPAYDINAEGDTLGFLGWDAAYGIAPATAVKVEEGGYLDEFAFHWAANINNAWHVGLGLNVRSLYYTKHLTYEEALSSVNQDYLRHHAYVRQSGAGFSASAGVIWQPLSFLRAGLAIQSPVLASVSTRTNSAMKLFDSGNAPGAETLVYQHRDKLTLPLRTTAGLTFLFGRKGLLSLQYDYRHIAHINDIHTLKLGAEIVPINNLFLNLGYACESDFRRDDQLFFLKTNDVRTDGDFRHRLTAHYASAGIGFRSNVFVAQLAYQFGFRNSRLYPFAVSDPDFSPAPFDMNTMTHRIVLTLAWHTH